MNVFIANSQIEQIKLLTEHLLQLDSKIKIIGEASTYDEALNFFKNKSAEVNLVFCQTHLQEEPAFSISKYIPETCRIIFTSASKLNAYEAFKEKSFDYLLEPFEYNDVKFSLINLHASNSSIYRYNKPYKKRFIIKFGDKIQFRKAKEVSYIYAEGKMAYMITREPTRKYIIEYTLDELEKNLLDPSVFFRINRKFIVNIDSIEEARQYVNSRLKLILNPPNDVDMIVSREKVNDFKKWLNL